MFKVHVMLLVATMLILELKSQVSTVLYLRAVIQTLAFLNTYRDIYITFLYIIYLCGRFETLTPRIAT